MSYVYYNPNPANKDVGDCVVRAFAAATDSDWDTAYLKLVLRGYVMHDMPSSNAVWDAQLMHEGFKRSVVPDTMLVGDEMETVMVDMVKEEVEEVETVTTMNEVTAVNIVET